jgi:NAD(P)H dehydrogenase (quinone)
MKIGIIVHSKTGTTLRFAEFIKKELEKKHSVDIIQLKTDQHVDFKKPGQKIQLVDMPNCTKYDTILAGGPVWAFSASPVIMEFIKNTQFKNKTFIPFVTMGFPSASMGGKQAIALMGKTAAEQGAKPLHGKVVQKLFHNQDMLMKNAAVDIANLLLKK